MRRPEQYGATAMTNVQRGSAQIIQFPTSARATVGGHRAADKSAAKPAWPRIAKVAVGGAWYHEAAIQSDAQDEKN